MSALETIHGDPVDLNQYLVMEERRFAEEMANDPRFAAFDDEEHEEWRARVGEEYDAAWRRGRERIKARAVAYNVRVTPRPLTVAPSAPVLSIARTAARPRGRRGRVRRAVGRLRRRAGPTDPSDPEPPGGRRSDDDVDRGGAA